MTLVLRYAARSDRGLIRGTNQDSVYAGPRLLAVADGMGGHAAGDVASKVVIAALEHLDDDAPSGDLLQALRQAVFDGSEHLREVIREAPHLEGMGTTLTAVLFAGGRLGLCHVGDSRAYLMRDGELAQITHDDTFVQTLIDDGRITEEEANSHPQRSLLLRALNGQDVEPDLSMRDARAGDRYLLCSDGLSGVVTFETLASAMRDPDPQATADRLIELALRSGGPDNITCIVADVVEDDGRGALIEPVVDGAAGDNRGQRDVDPRSAAGRAALADPQPAQQSSPAASSSPPPRRRRPARTALIALATVVVLGAAAIGTYLFVMDHWFVGVAETADGDEVAVFQGVDASIVGIDLYRLDRSTGLATSDLTQAARSRVSGGIDASDRADAERILANLREQQLEPCRPASSTAASTTSAAPSGATTPAPAPGAPTTAADPAATGAPTPPAPTTTGSTTSTGRSSSGEPGVDCREAD
ncbi:PP2C family protein-serine/threonine phosphatase [Modestobacter versicolor]|uniref:Serine/threonine protein phosphatase PstP n=1 Tax=Modestobacter versicolor TaxID=429133 RepID=A0A323V6S0_9ACTN|nr:protein phosphatase 2C domain-containing protein [Modestobacter versicolor]MBB3677330.1 protein phosphatase [Modestobacter versicolor]PZA20515.1 protein phosphatase [Modestobacter versicolor]